ncbi:NAD(P)/FAD-dependent oxidoreductase [Hansschlegelia plantiphila]|uniref:NAD/FAD-binding protein n=1 Tax=Hansschlegelia plantiphila TaxID=374655 RepID=A0A9W6J589_9HYPH|nr:FAD-dependent oxidoreductase [Hansschlegelia plantiphila]GLK69589.1 NAD/FAD-binding protein [Hansschlegelia plantiphila]
MRIAVVGSGIAGNAAAWALSERHDVVVYERELRPGGHSHTVDIDYDGVPIAVDTGFIVYNELNYPNLTALFAELGVVTRRSEMSFGLSLDGGALEWSGKTLGTLFAQRRNLVALSYLWMLREVLRFNRLCREDLAAGVLSGLSLGAWLDRHRLSRRFRDDYLIPMAAAIWSTPSIHVLDFPAESFIAFFDNHRLIDAHRPLWRTVDGGSRAYVERLTRRFRDGIRLGSEVSRIERDDRGVTIVDARGERDRFDQVVVACHSDDALRLLAKPSDAEREILSAIRYRPNDVVLHRDERLMPKRRAVWSAWNYLGTRNSAAAGRRDVAVTYWMNELQGIDRRTPLFITLNPPIEPEPSKIFRRFSYSHPQYDAAALAAQRRLPSVQGLGRTWFCGAWTGYGFHEDGLTSGLDVAERLGCSIPWRDPVFAEAAE